MKALVMCLSDPSGDPRPNRIIHLLSKNGYSVDILSYRIVGNVPVVKKFSVQKPSQEIFPRTVRFIRAVVSSTLARLKFIPFQIAEYVNNQRYKLLVHEKELNTEDYDFITVEDLHLLPLAFRIRKDAKILFDAREFYTKQFEESFLFRWFEFPFRDRLCRQYLQYCDQLITVSSGLADGYFKDFGVHMEVIRSTPSYFEIPVQATNKNKIRMVHHGVANQNRGIENMIEIVSQLDNHFTLDLYLIGPDSYITFLKELSSNCDRICICNPVPFDEIVPMLNRYDIGLYYLEPLGYNVTYNLPNKFFEFIQARLAIAIGPSPEMAKLVNEFQCGFVAPKFSLESMAKTLQMLTTEDIDKAKLKSDQAAKQLCFEVEGKRLLELVDKIHS